MVIFTQQRNYMRSNRETLWIQPEFFSGQSHQNLWGVHWPFVLGRLRWRGCWRWCSELYCPDPWSTQRHSRVRDTAVNCAGHHGYCRGRIIGGQAKPWRALWYCRAGGLFTPEYSPARRRHKNAFSPSLVPLAAHHSHTSIKWACGWWKTSEWSPSQPSSL